MNDTNGSFPTLQYSKFIGQDQVVVRSNDRDEFIKLVNFVNNDMPLILPTPTATQSFSNRPVYQKKEKNYTGELCPKDGGKLYSMTTKTGKLMTKCDNSKYDFATKTSSGCDYIDWGKEF